MPVLLRSEEQVRTYRSPRGTTIYLSPSQVELLEHRRQWVFDDGQRFELVTAELHLGQASDVSGFVGPVSVS